MNNNLCNIIGKIFAYETNVTKMEKGRLTDCIDMRYHTKVLVKGFTDDFVQTFPARRKDLEDKKAGKKKEK